MCLYPRIGYNRKYIPNKKNGGNVPSVKDRRVLAVPIGCGKCMECRKKKAREWQIRLSEDVRHNTNGKFITLTFSNESIIDLKEELQTKKTRIRIGEKKYTDKNGLKKTRGIYKEIETEQKITGYELDNAIASIAIRKWTERWRKRYRTAPRHWMITELGHGTTEHLHMHGIVWTDEKTKAIKETWGYGWIWEGKNENGKKINYVNEKTVNYLIKYVHKQDKQHQEYKPRIFNSKGMGIGYFKRTDWIKNKYNEEKTNEAYQTKSGLKMAIPIYYRNKIYTEEEREKLWLEKLDTNIRYVGGEKINISENEEEYYKAIAYQRKINKRLGYGDNEKNWKRKEYEETRRNLMLNKRTGDKAKTKDGLPLSEQVSYSQARAANNEAMQPNWNF